MIDVLVAPDARWVNDPDEARPYVRRDRVSDVAAASTPDEIGEGVVGIFTGPEAVCDDLLHAWDAHKAGVDAGHGAPGVLIADEAAHDKEGAEMILSCWKITTRFFFSSADESPSFFF